MFGSMLSMPLVTMGYADSGKINANIGCYGRGATWLASSGGHGSANPLTAN